jgi:hypothetical protein
MAARSEQVLSVMSYGLVTSPLFCYMPQKCANRLINGSYREIWHAEGSVGYTTRESGILSKVDSGGVMRTTDPMICYAHASLLSVLMLLV